MHNAEKVTNDLVKLNDLESKLKKAKNKAAIQKEIDALRNEIPTPMLSHHDRICYKKKSSVARVKKWTCTSCHIQVPRGMHGKLQVVTDLVICENCGVYLYLDDEEREALQKQAEEKKPVTKTKK